LIFILSHSTRQGKARRMSYPLIENGRMKKQEKKESALTDDAAIHAHCVFSHFFPLMNSADISAHKRSTRKASAKKDSTLTPGGYRRRKANSYQSLASN
jgi:hypothetical protein